MKKGEKNERKIFNVFLLVLLSILTICLSFGRGTHASAQDEVNVNVDTVEQTVTSLFTTYYNDGTYRKNTSIFADIDAISADAIELGETASNYFHANNVPALERTTDYTPGKLLMTTESDQLGVGYKDVEGNMVRFHVDESGVEKSDFTVKSTSVEDYYVTLKDFSDQSVTNEYSDLANDISDAEWVVDEDGYSTADAEVIDAFRLFTAPMWLGKTEKNANYITYSKATVEESHGQLVMKLWVSSADYGKIVTNETFVEGKSYVFSQATIQIPVVKGVSSYDGNGSVQVANEYTNPIVTTTDTNYSAVSFNTSGKHYYVEMTMSQLSSYVNGQIYALTHNISSLGDPSEGTYYSGFKFNADNYEYANSKYMLTSWAVNDARAWLPSAYADARVDGLNASFKTGTTKIAIARVGDYFYYFVNDKLYAYALYPELASENTYPGLLFRGNGSAISAEFSNFEFIREQNEIQNKVNSLIGGSTFERYVNKTESSTYVTFDNNGATYKTGAELGGTAGADTNNTAANLRVSPYVHVYGNWEISYDVTPSTLGDSDNYGKLILLVSTLQDRQNVFEWYDLTNSTSFLLGSACGNSNISANTSATAIAIKTIEGSTIQPFARSYGTYHVTVKCEVKENLIETYTISITAGENNEVNMSATFDIQYTSQTYLHGGAKWFCFKSEKWAGTISNFTVKNI